MTVTSSSVFDRVRVACNCDGMNVSAIAAYLGTQRLSESENIGQDTTDAGEIAELQVMQDAIDAGTADLYYVDQHLDPIRTTSTTRTA